MKGTTRVITAVGLARLNGLQLRAYKRPGQPFTISLKKKPPEKKR